MTEIERTDHYIIYRYDTALEFIRHYNENFQYLKDSWMDEDKNMCASYDIDILGKKDKLIFFVAANSKSWESVTNNYRQNIVDKIKQNSIIDKKKDIEKLHILMNIAVDFNDKIWFNELANRLNKINT